jgi:hypothetical protein
MPLLAQSNLVFTMADWLLKNLSIRNLVHCPICLMKPIEYQSISDPFDREMRQRLQRWALNQELPATGRQRLLNAAAQPLATEPSRFLLWLEKWSPAPRSSYRPFGERLVGPFTQTKAWSFHLATSYRLVT